MAMTKTERLSSVKTLTCLLQALEGERTVVELRDDATIVGVVNNVDSKMNVELVDVVHRSRYGVERRYEKFFLASKFLRYVHIPDHVDISAVLTERIERLTRRPVKKFDQSKTNKEKRKTTLERHLSKQGASSNI